MSSLDDPSRSTADGCVTVKLVVGETIGQYRVTGVIGRGGMGAVYAVEHMLLGRPAAVKVLLSELSQKQDIVMRFFNEAKAAAAIRHPGIVEIYDFGWSPNNSAYIVMERLEGETLARRAARGRLPWQTALGVARQIAGALGAAHSKGIIHRDLKPDNVFLVPDPEVPGGERIKLLDFGIAKLAGHTAGSQTTDTGVVIGTPSYMAPEQCRGVPIDHRADLYALGCVLFQLCTGRAPFSGEGPGDILAAHIHVPPPRIGALVPEVSPEFEDLLQRLLAKQPQDRPRNADEVIHAIDDVTAGTYRTQWRVRGSRNVRAISGSPVAAELPGAGPTVVTAGPRHRTLIGAAGVAVAVLALIVLIISTYGTVGPGDMAALGARDATAATAEGPAAVPGSVPPSTPDPPPPAPSAPATEPPAPSVAAPPAPATEPPAPSVAAPPAPATEPPAPTPRPPATAPPAPPVSPSPQVRPSGSPPAPAPSTPATEPPATGPPSPPVDLPDPPAPSPRPPAPAPPPHQVRPPDVPPPARRVDLIVDSTPAGADVVLDDVVLGKTPFRGTVARRNTDVNIVVRLRGHADRRIVARADRSIVRRVDLISLPAPAARPRSRDESVNPFAK